MSVCSIKTGLGKKYKDMLSAVKGQMCDGYWENTPMMQGYWRFCKIGTAGDEMTIEVDDASGARIGDRFIENRFRGMSDDAVKKFFADKIKFLIKEEGLGKWDRGNENETDFLSYGDPRYRVKDCYYAYEILKGRDARKHPEYGDVEESKKKTETIKIGIKLIKKTNEASKKTVLTIEGGRVMGITYAMAKALGQTEVDVHVDGTGPFGEDEGAVAISFDPEDAEGEMDLDGSDEDVLTPKDATNIIVFDKELGQSGCDWSDYELVEPDIYVRTDELAEAVAVWQRAGLI